MKTPHLLLVVLLALILVTVPYLVADLAEGSSHVFQGFLFNPVDGNTYLAKMYQGCRGDWQFTLPYSPDPGSGTNLFLFYLSLGHLSRISGLSLPFVFHLARVFSSLLLWWAIYRFWQRSGFSGGWLSLAFTLSIFGSGLGWLVVVFGGFSMDFWVAEAFPFLSAFSNPHFALGLALMLVLLTLPAADRPAGAHSILTGALNLAAGVVLAVTAPFGAVIVLVVLALWLGWMVLDWQCDSSQTTTGRTFLPASRQVPGFYPVLWRFLLTLAGAAPWLVYDIWLTSVHPQLATWNAQNLTPSAPVWDLLLSISPTCLLALYSIAKTLRSRNETLRLLMIWFGVGLVLTYLPLGLQRRFMMGLYLPAAGLAVYALQALAVAKPLAAGRIGLALLFLSIPTNLLVIAAGWHGVQSRDPLLYLTAAEAQTLAWVEDNTPANALILASPESGLFIPARSGRRVLYGHPFETVDADFERQVVLDLLQQKGIFAITEDAQQYLRQRGVDYVFWGPRETALGGEADGSFLTPLYQNGEVVLYKVQP